MDIEMIGRLAQMRILYKTGPRAEEIQWLVTKLWEALTRIDSYDPEFGTGENAYDVRCAIETIVETIERNVGSKLINIVELAQSKRADIPVPIGTGWTERELRIIRFGLLRALDSL